MVSLEQKIVDFRRQTEDFRSELLQNVTDLPDQKLFFVSRDALILPSISGRRPSPKKKGYFLERICRSDYIIPDYRRDRGIRNRH
jgi:hypothetical protein